MGNGLWGGEELSLSLAFASEFEGRGGAPSDPTALGWGGPPPAVPIGAGTGEEIEEEEGEEIGEPHTPALSPATGEREAEGAGSVGSTGERGAEGAGSFGPTGESGAVVGAFR